MTDIVTITAGSYTPAAKSSLDAMASVINASWTQGLSMVGSYQAAVNSATTGFLDVTSAPTISAGSVAAPSVTEPGVTIPASVDVSDITAMFDTKYLELVALLAGKFADFISTYAPDEQAQYEATATWLSDALADPATGLPAAVAAQILEDDKSRILADASRASDAVLAQFAARRFPLPPGAAAAATLEIQQKAQDEIAASGRNLVKMSIEQMRFVIQQTIALRQLTLDSAIKYITALASGPDMASRLVGIGYDAQSKLISSASQFYNSRIAAAELTSKVGQFNVGTSLDAAAKNQAAELALVEDKLKALLSECQAIAQMATSLFNNVHAQVGAQTSVSS